MKVKELIKDSATGRLVSGSTAGESPPTPTSSKIRNCTVSGKPNVEMPPGTLNYVLKQTGLKKYVNLCNM